MVQGIALLPEFARVDKPNFLLEIKDHKIHITYPYTASTNLFGWMVYASNDKEWKNIKTDMQLQKISYEAIIEQCAAELEEDPHIPYNVHSFIYDVREYSYNTIAFSASEAGEKIMQSIVSEIRNSTSYEEFATIFNVKGVFITDIKNRIRKEVECIIKDMGTQRR